MVLPKGKVLYIEDMENIQIAITLANCVASILEVTGAYLLFKYANPPHNNRLGIAVVGIGNDIHEKIEDNKKYNNKSIIGFRFIAAGFVVQLISNTISLIALQYA